MPSHHHMSIVTHTHSWTILRGSFVYKLAVASCFSQNLFLTVAPAPFFSKDAHWFDHTPAGWKWFRQSFSRWICENSVFKSQQCCLVRSISSYCGPENFSGFLLLWLLSLQQSLPAIITATFSYILLRLLTNYHLFLIFSFSLFSSSSPPSIFSHLLTFLFKLKLPLFPPDFLFKILYFYIFISGHYIFFFPFPALILLIICLYLLFPPGTLSPLFLRHALFLLLSLLLLIISSLSSPFYLPLSPWSPPPPFPTPPSISAFGLLRFQRYKWRRADCFLGNLPLIITGGEAQGNVGGAETNGKLDFFTELEWGGGSIYWQAINRP